MAEENNESFKLVEFSNFIRTNPKSDRFKVKKFHHAEFWCSDASNTARRFSWGLGMGMRAKSDLSTGNMTHASYLISSGNLNLLFTAPYSPSISEATTLSPTETAAIPSFNYAACRAFSAAHGLAIRAIAIEVGNAEESFSISVSHGAKPAFPPILLENHAVLAEIYLYGDVVLSYISFKTSNSDPETFFYQNLQKLKRLRHHFRWITESVH